MFVRWTVLFPPALRASWGLAMPAARGVGRGLDLEWAAWGRGGEGGRLRACEGRRARAGAPGPPSPGLIAPETEAAVASSVGGLLRTLGDHVPVYRGGPTIEDIVREEMRPLLKQWLDTHLQALVERQVRAEIERIVGRAVS